MEVVPTYVFGMFLVEIQNVYVLRTTDCLMMKKPVFLQVRQYIRHSLICTIAKISEITQVDPAVF